MCYKLIKSRVTTHIIPQNAVFVNTAFCGGYNNLGDCMFKRIRDLREDHDLTQKQMTEILNCSQQVYSNYELGQRDIPTDILIKLSRFYKVSTDYILGLSDNPNPTK